MCNHTHMTRHKKLLKLDATRRYTCCMRSLCRVNGISRSVWSHSSKISDIKYYLLEHRVCINTKKLKCIPKYIISTCKILLE